MVLNIPAFALTIAEGALVQPWLWFTHLLTNSGMTGIYLAALAMFLAFKFLVAPFLGATGDALSDTAAKRGMPKWKRRELERERASRRKR